MLRKGRGVYTLHQRRDPAPGQPRPHADRDRRGGRACPSARAALGGAGLLRLDRPQREGHLREVPGLVRRQPGPPPPAPAGRVGACATSRPWVAPTPCVARGRDAFAAGEYRWVAELVDHVVFAEPDQPGGPRAPGRRPRAARLPGRVGDVAQRLPLGRPGAARRLARLRDASVAARPRPTPCGPCPSTCSSPTWPCA